MSFILHFWASRYDEVAEWLMRWTANPLCSARVGSNPILVDLLLIFVNFLLRNFNAILLCCVAIMAVKIYFWNSFLLPMNMFSSLFAFSPNIYS